jgi:hypothetical protein
VSSPLAAWLSQPAPIDRDGPWYQGPASLSLSDGGRPARPGAPAKNPVGSGSPQWRRRWPARLANGHATAPAARPLGPSRPGPADSPSRIGRPWASSSPAGLACCGQRSLRRGRTNLPSQPRALAPELLDSLGSTGRAERSHQCGCDRCRTSIVIPLMGNTANTRSSVLVPEVPVSTAFEEGCSLKSTCCSHVKDAPLKEKADGTTEAQTRRGVRRVSLNTSGVRSAPYTSKIDIEGKICTPTLSVDDPEICLEIKFISDCKNSAPVPLSCWTIQEQQVLIDSLNLHPQARENDSYRQKLMKRIRKDLPSKSLDEIRECYRYLQDVRVAHVRYSRATAIRPASPRHGGTLVTLQT